MVEKILLLDKLSRVELIKLLNIDNLEIEKLLDLKIVVEKELKNKYKVIDQIEFKSEYNNFYNKRLSDKYNKLDDFSLGDLVKLLKIEDMDFCELLYLDIIIENALSKVLLIRENVFFDEKSSLFSLYDYGTFNFGKINCICIDGLIYGFDNRYNFYVGKVDKDKNCVLFSVMRKGLPYEIVHDILVFDGMVSDNGRLSGFWNVGSSEVRNGINKINSMNNENCIGLCNSIFDIRNLNIAYSACNERANSLDGLLRSINNTEDKLSRG